MIYVSTRIDAEAQTRCYCRRRRRLRRQQRLAHSQTDREVRIILKNDNAWFKSRLCACRAGVVG